MMSGTLIHQAAATQLTNAKNTSPRLIPILADLHRAFADVVALQGWAANDPVWHYHVLEYGSPHRELLKTRMDAFADGHDPVTDPKLNINLDPDTGKPRPCRPDFKEPFNWQRPASYLAVALTIIGFLVMPSEIRELTPRGRITKP